MKVFRPAPEGSDPKPRPSVVAIGNFDGVHRGHQRILRQAVEAARRRGLASGVLTFDPHPTEVVAPSRRPPLMTTIERRLELFEELGLDFACVLRFDEAFAAQTPEEFVRAVLLDLASTRGVVVGSNFRFGRKGAGDVARLRELGREYDYFVEAVEPVVLGGEVVSSSRIRAAVTAGRTLLAKRLLGRPFELRGTVVSGRGIGAKLTAPTLNCDPETDLLPKDGVYVTETVDLASGRCYPAVTNVGVRPTFGPGRRTVESHLIDARPEAAPARLEVRFLSRVRDERRFDSAEDLKRQILLDVERARRVFRLREALGFDDSADVRSA